MNTVATERQSHSTQDDGSTPARAQTAPTFRSDPQAHRDGLALFQKMHGAHSGEQLVAALRDICPDFADMTIDWRSMASCRDRGWTSSRANCC